MLCYHLFILVVYLISTTHSSSGWNNPSSNQYHIQTDEGPERYFRYQTDSGQYRKEKRLEDGTVIGTYAWIDDNGFLRQRDYIADNAGYRILKSKNVFVGRNIRVGDAIKAAKKVPASAGTLVSPNSAATRPVIGVPKYVAPTTAYIPSTTVVPPLSSTLSSPFVEISPNSFPSTTPSPIYSSTVSNYLDSSTPASVISTTSNPSLLLLPPNNTFSTLGGYYSSPQVPSTTALPTYEYLPQTTPAALYNNYNPQINQNSLDYNPYVSHLDNSFVFQNGPTYPIDRRGQAYNGQRIGNGYDPQYPYYDGVSVTNDGFRYYIPRAYHEEQNLPGDKKTGSFGYIDPFGIRRVIYYNTAPGTGFQHRKNNRYVGFQATPYDPRPY